MLSDALTKRLNEQINLEFYSSNLYLQMSAWCSHEQFDGCAAFLKQHSDEEKGHMDKLFNYLHETGGLPILGAIETPHAMWKSVPDIFKAAYEHEKTVSKSINQLVDQALKEEDFSTFNFLQWYVAEQHEEEHLFKSILDKIALFAPDIRGLYDMDRELGEMAGDRG